MVKGRTFVGLLGGKIQWEWQMGREDKHCSRNGWLEEKMFEKVYRTM
jgi:hypothetical protein